VLAWLRYFVSFWRSSFGLDEGSVHELLEYDEHRVAAYTSAICTVLVALYAVSHESLTQR
jgi:hypothetical protein